MSPRAGALALCLSLLALAPARGDGGGEDWVTPPSELHRSLRKTAAGAVLADPGPADPAAVWTYLSGEGGWTPLKTLPADEFVPVSRRRVPPGAEGRLHPLAGARFILLSRQGEFAELVYDSSRGSSGWFRLSDFRPRVIDFKAVPRGQYMVSLSSVSAGFTRAYVFPEESRRHLLLRGAFEVRPDEQSGDFLRLRDERWNAASQRWESAPVGWVRLHDAAGNLLYWPWEDDGR